LAIKVLNKTNKEVIKQIKEVEIACKAYDKTNGSITLDTSLNYDQEMKSLFLFYADNILVSVLSIFMPLANQAEISGFTLPEHRRKGYFKELLNKAIEELKNYEKIDLLFVCEPQSVDGKEFIRKYGAKLDFTEYFLRYKGFQVEAGKRHFPEIKLQEAGLTDLDAIIDLSRQIFNDEYENAKSIIEKSIKAGDRTQYLAILNGHPIGIGAVSIERDEASIFGLGISPQFQGKGFGKELLNLILNDLKNKNIKNIVIEVDSNNKNAFHLYCKCGFEAETSFDYYRKCITAVSV